MYIHALLRRLRVELAPIEGVPCMVGIRVIRAIRVRNARFFLVAEAEVEGADVGGRTAEQFVLQLEVGSARLHLEALR